MQVTIDGKKRTVEEKDNILKACHKLGIEIPHLCYHPDLKQEARCRLCLVKVDGKIVTSCNTYFRKGMSIITEDEELERLRKLNLKLIFSHHQELLKEDHHEAGRLAKKFDLQHTFDKKEKLIDDSGPALYRDNSKCILCGRCVQKCQEVQGVNAIGFMGRGHDARVSTAADQEMEKIACTYCGQCTNVCPTHAIREREYLEEVKKAIADPGKIVIVQTAPAVRVTIGETQGLPPGKIMTGKLVTALRKLGFDKVLDTNFGADLTIMEEGTELISRLTGKAVLPMITSCSPGWIKYIENFFPDLLPHLSSCKSPHQMVGAIAKTYYAKKNKIDPKDMVVVSIMPCVAKKFECNRPEMKSSGFQDVDYVLTTRELGKWLHEEKIELERLADEDYNMIMGESSGAAAIFGATGGVMEAALRTVADILEKKDLPKFEYLEVRGMKGIKEASVKIAGRKINVAIAHGLLNARVILEEIAAGKSKYHFIEIMACPGGCIGGGGQPMPTTQEIIKKRAEAIYQADKKLPIRKSHQNQEILQLYEKFLEKPGSKKAHQLLHTKYTKRKND